MLAGVPGRAWLLATASLAWHAPALAAELEPTGRAQEPGSPSYVTIPAPHELTISGGSNCPEPEAVRAELLSLIPPSRLDAHLSTRAEALDVHLDDLGGAYRVAASGRSRDHRDAARDCRRRAQVAALFVALIIDPAGAGMPVSEAAHSTPPAAPAPTSPPPPARVASFRFELGAAASAGLGGAGAVQYGLALRFVLGRRVALVIGGTASGPLDTTLSGVSLRQWRLPLDVGLRLVRSGQRVTTHVDVGLLAALISERATALATARSETSLEMGLRLSAGLALHGSRRIAPFGALHLEVVPVPVEVFALPRGVLGHTPYIWFGATLGAMVEVL